jgi:hypothetical protein
MDTRRKSHHRAPASGLGKGMGTGIVLALLLALPSAPALAAGPVADRESPSPVAVASPADRLAFTAHRGTPTPGGSEAAVRDAGGGEERLQAHLVVAPRARLAPYVGVNARSRPQSDRSAGIATGEVETVDLGALAGVRLLAGRSATVRLFLTVGGATLDEENRLETGLDRAPADFGMAWSVTF